MLRVRPARVLAPFYRLRAMVVSNVFVIDGGAGDRFIVDTGHRLERTALLAGLRGLPFSPREITGVLLTHHHSDHAGNAAYLRATFGIPVLAHAADAAVLAGSAPRPRLVARSGDRLARAFATIENLSTTRVPVDRELSHGDTIGSLEVHHAPGHTPGSLLFRHAHSASLLSGDALLAAVPPLTIRQRMCLPHPDYAASYAQAIDSMRAFCRAGWRFEHLLAGHGRPILGRAREQAVQLLELEAASR